MVNYLIENEECEREFMGRLRSFWSNLAPIFRSFGIDPHCCWALFEVQMQALVPGIRGDVDILLGNIEWEDRGLYETALNQQLERQRSASENALIQFMSVENLAADDVARADGIKWPPSTDYLVGIEVKCSRLAAGVNPSTQSIGEKEMKSTGSSWKKQRRLRIEIDKLIQLGCNKVGLLDLIVNPPSDGQNIHAWFNASAVASRTESAMARILANRLPTDSPACHWVYSIGAIAGGDETIRGAGSPQQYRPGVSIPDVSLNKNRSTTIENAAEILHGLPIPRQLPALFVNCRACKRTHTATDHGCGGSQNIQRVTDFL
jgi:hypothetical protein